MSRFDQVGFERKWRAECLTLIKQCVKQPPQMPQTLNSESLQVYLIELKKHHRLWGNPVLWMFLWPFMPFHLGLQLLLNLGNSVLIVVFSTVYFVILQQVFLHEMVANSVLYNIVFIAVGSLFQIHLYWLMALVTRTKKWNKLGYAEGTVIKAFLLFFWIALQLLVIFLHNQFAVSSLTLLFGFMTAIALIHGRDRNIYQLNEWFHD
jgi:predicted neutral ceramidase superfamily lipid hydrolase